ncbi:MAG TPA: hypothetical protein VKA82_09520 [Rubrobacter sp.]|nr:hypothetical protein [Rubrobacter sp.]
MYQQVYDPIAGSLVLLTIVAIIPIVVLFVLLAGVRIAAQWASLATLVTLYRQLRASTTDV